MSMWMSNARRDARHANHALVTHTQLIRPVLTFLVLRSVFIFCWIFFGYVLGRFVHGVHLSLAQSTSIIALAVDCVSSKVIGRYLRLSAIFLCLLPSAPPPVAMSPPPPHHPRPSVRRPSLSTPSRAYRPILLSSSHLQVHSGVIS